MLTFDQFFLVGEWIGTAAFAISGAMIAIDKRTDIFGVILLAVFTALGGGTVRDILIGYFPPRMFSNGRYVLLAAFCAVVVFVIARIFKERYIRMEKEIEHINCVFDAIGLGVFAVSGASIGMEAGFADNLLLVVSLGTVTGIGGGMLRDIMIQEMPFVLKKHIYAVAAMAGALTFYLLTNAGMTSTVSYSAGWLVTFVLRMLAIHYKWNLPRAI
ncbi:MAG: trimeric intracellular cation channel family protein [Clostridia bacterium]|nr:trimeric intracellular cation channel family protein [Clostridia bacterium]